MKKLIAFLFPQWELYEIIQAGWSEYTKGPTTSKALYEIFYSERRKKYKLVVSGHNPKLHSAFETVVEHMWELNHPEVHPEQMEQLMDYLVEHEMYEAAEMIKNINVPK